LFFWREKVLLVSVPTVLFRFMLVSYVVPLESRSMVWQNAWRKVDHITP